MPADPSASAPLLTTRDEAARLLCCCARTIDKMVRTGELPVVHVGRAVRIPIAAISQYVAQGGQKAAQ